MGIIGAVLKLVIPSGDEHTALEVKIERGAGGSIDQPCKLGRFYVYIHKDSKDKVFYVGKGTGGRAHSRDRPSEWEEYVAKHSGGKFSVEIVRDGISEEDALVVEDALMAQYATTIVNRVNMHAPYDSKMMLAYCDANKRYGDGLKRAVQLADAGDIDTAATEFEQAYAAFFDVASNSGYHQGARKELDATAFNFRPHALADRYTKALSRAGRHAELAAFADRYFRDYGAPSNSTEEALKKRADKARAKADR